MSGYDIIGDVHGCASKLKGLLDTLGYRQHRGAYRHPNRQAIFVGDLIDRGREQVETVELVSDELTAVCPITNQPDFYTATIEYRPERLCLESKSVKIYLSRFRDEGAFCEALAVRIRDEVAAALELEPGRVHVSLRQKARGGITITASV